MIIDLNMWDTDVEKIHVADFAHPENPDE